MDVFEAMLTRRSVARLVDPAPDWAILERAFQAAVYAPDHGRLRPWRFLLIEGQYRQKFGDLLAQAAKVADPTASEVSLERERAKPLRAPLIVVAAARVTRDNPAVPPTEQLLAVAAATENFILALHAQGIGAMWRTGAGAHSPVVKQGLDLAATDEIVGFIYVGAIGAPPAPQAVNESASFVARWRGQEAERSQASSSSKLSNFDNIA